MRRFALVTVVLAGTGLLLWGLLFPSNGPVTAASDAGPLLIAYSETGFLGRSLEVRDTVLDLPVIESEDGTKFDWNDSIQSIRVVRGTWRLYQHGRSNTELDDTPLELLDLERRSLVKGWSALVSATSRGPLELTSAEAGAWEDISSIGLVSERHLPDWAAP